MSEVDITATEAMEDSNPSEKEIKAADRQKTLESIGFYNATSFQGKHALGPMSITLE